ncbi:hypothetical protein [Glycomyces harbinensis]|uniref:Uncharacterized protein n=1 Tax=Glycomyces harbinensis TaxID=58114 RepID=A0A1G6T4T6_9ACTN|nr:hypothetical protein [Glycomyces harbinensis]SDD24068.1 hypothetical protein SAMN05216270_102482 [Glycomyces harbinensis]
MTSTYETEEPQAPEAQAPEPSEAGPLILLNGDESVGMCDLEGECR